MIKTAIIVPARLASQRFPEKLLFQIEGKPLILWTAENLLSIAGELPIYFAVGEERLAKVIEKEGYSVVRTDPTLPSGTDRIQAANRELGYDRVINVQADEPVLSGEHLKQLIDALEDGADMATLATSFENLKAFRDPNKVKVVLSGAGRALYFSRSAIPFQRDTPDQLPANAYWHMGLYGYTKTLLARFSTWKPGTLEQIEKLEQLRVLENGYSIGVGISSKRTVGIDTPDDVEALKLHLGL